MSLDDGAADRQSHANPIRLGRIERLEQSIEVRWTNSWAGILHFDKHEVWIVLARGNRELTRSVSEAAHGLDGIDEQIHDHLLQLDPIRCNQSQVFRKPSLQPDAILLHFGLGQGNDLADCLIDIQAVSSRRHFLDERTDAVDDLAGATAVSDDATKRLPSFFQIRRLCAQPAQTGMRVSHCRRNRLIDFVRDRSRHLAQQHDPIEARKIGLGLLESRLGAFPISDIDDNGTAEGWRAVCRGNDKRSDVSP